jgi:hypothetical protein
MRKDLDRNGNPSEELLISLFVLLMGAQDERLYVSWQALVVMVSRIQQFVLCEAGY